jgi:hypothetical protein
MAHDFHAANAAEPQVPPQLLAARRADWHSFTRSLEANIAAIAAFLVLLLLVFRVF